MKLAPSTPVPRRASLREALSQRADLRRFMVFLATGGLAALVNIISRLALQSGLEQAGLRGDAPYEIAVVLAYLIGMITAFVLAKSFVFDVSERHIHVQFGRFALVNAVSLLQVWIVSVILAHHVFPAIGYAWNAETLAHIIGVLSPVLTSYYGHKRFSFR